jgi:hypothetical protein
MTMTMTSSSAITISITITSLDTWWLSMSCYCCWPEVEEDVEEALRSDPSPKL